MLEISNLVKTFVGSEGRRRRSTEAHNDVRAIDDVSFDIKPGEVFTLLGPSGCGKSTTLRSIAGLEQPDSGSIKIAEKTVFDGRKIRLGPNDRQLSMVFQSYAIWPHMDVFRNAAFPLEVMPRRLRPSKNEIRSRVEEVLAAVHLDGLGSRPAVKLSGGQQQRLALARAIVTNPKLLLLDEPLSNLDAKLRESMRLELKRLQRSLGLTALYVTHDQGEALALSSRIAVMNKGKVVQLGTPREIYEDPNCRFVAEFIGTSNVLEGTVSAVDGEVADISTEQGLVRSTSWRDLRLGDKAIVIIRPEDLVLRDDSPAAADVNYWNGKVVAGGYLGEAIDYVIAVNGREFRARVNPQESGRVETEVFVTVSPGRVHILPPERSAA